MMIGLLHSSSVTFDRLCRTFVVLVVMAVVVVPSLPPAPRHGGGSAATAVVVSCSGSEACYFERKQQQQQQHQHPADAADRTAAGNGADDSQQQRKVQTAAAEQTASQPAPPPPPLPLNYVQLDSEELRLRLGDENWIHGAPIADLTSYRCVAAASTHKEYRFDPGGGGDVGRLRRLGVGLLCRGGRF